jgi:HAMP domain-containing protein/predicted Ser/Thr protein kinase
MTSPGDPPSPSAKRADDGEPTQLVTPPRSAAADIDDDSTRVVGPGAWPAAAPVPARDDDATRVRPDATAPATPAHLASRPGTAPTSPTSPTSPSTPGSPTGTLPGQPLTGAASRDAAASDSGEGAVRQVGRYLIQSRLGRGGMATVYRAHDPQIGRAVAIKFLHASLAEDDECRGRFLREARAAGGLSHPNIVVVHDVGEIEGRPYMAMELVDGQPLAEVLEKTKQLPLRDAVLIALQLARALDYAHTRGIVHRDIKPGNIMLRADRTSVTVTDFGIAHMDDGGSQRTQVGAVLGTPQYMSPEQTRGDKLDGRSDLFSAGIVLYQMLAGQRPFRGDSLVAVATKIANESPAPLTQLRPEVPSSLRRVVDRCLAKAPAQRYASGKEMADALVKVLADIDEVAREKNKPRILPLRVKWALAMAAIIATVMGITATIVTQRQYAALMGQATEYGASLARFIARQNAASALGEEWEVVDVAVQEMMKTGNFERIVFIDKAGVVRASNVPAQVGQGYKPAGTESLGNLAGGTAAMRYHVGDESVLGFESPVTFQDTVVGRVALGIPEKPLTQVARLSITLMIILALVTVAAVALAMYFLADWFAKPIRLVSESLGEIAKGNFTHRISETRKDEFGQLYVDFDAMAQALQIRETPVAAAVPAAEPAPESTTTVSSPAPPSAGTSA